MVIMKYYVEENNASDFFNVFMVSNIDFEIYNSYDPATGILNPPNEPCIFFITYEALRNICKINIKKWLEIFFENKSYLIVDQEIDNTTSLVGKRFVNSIDAFEKYKNQILFYYNGILEDNSIFKNLNLVKKTNSEYLIKTPDYYYNSKIQELKISRSNNFLLTTILKKYRPHRSLLVEQLEKLNLLQKHIGKIHQNSDDDSYVPIPDSDWIGNCFSTHSWKSGIISWDLYNLASFEIVPENLCNDISWLTEKTLKPIVAKIPFLVLSNREYYKYLRTIGFKTFDSLIDESFADEEELTVRTKKLVETVNYIIENNALKFYEASKEICEHNFEQHLHLIHKEKYNAYISLYNFEKHLNIQN